MSDRLHVGTRKGVFTIERGGDRWQVTGSDLVGENCPIVLPDRRDSSLLVAINSGHFGQKLHRRGAQGAWQEVAAPAFPPRPEDEPEVRDPMRGEPVPWAVQMVWALEAGGPDRPGTLWAGTIPGALFRSDDGGGTWELVRPLWDRPERAKWFGGGYDWPGIHSICVDPRDSRRVTVGVSCGGVWRSDDAGDTWACRTSGMQATYMPPDQQDDPDVQDPHRVVQCAAEPDCLWAQHHNGIFRTTDGGRRWTPIDNAGPSTFGFAVAVHPRDPDTAWFVPAHSDAQRVPVNGRVVVTRTRDGGRSFDTLTHGLPQQHAYDIVYRHGLDVSDDGETLALGSTTGGLWISDDGGDAWQPVAMHLPPIYCVRWA